MTGFLRLSRLQNNFICGHCKERITGTGGRRRIAGEWICATCIPNVDTQRTCCATDAGRRHAAKCPMARPVVVK